MEVRHDHEHDVGVLPGLGGLQGGDQEPVRERPVGEPGALRPAGRARGVSQQGRVTLVDGDGAIGPAEPVEPFVKAARSRSATDNDVGRGRVADSMRGLRELHAGHEQWYPGVLDQFGELGPGTAPVERGKRASSPGRTEPHLEELHAVLAQEADVGTWRDPSRRDSARDLAGPVVELRVGKGAARVGEGRLARGDRRPVTGDIGKGPDFRVKPHGRLLLV